MMMMMSVRPWYTTRKQRRRNPGGRIRRNERERSRLLLPSPSFPKPLEPRFKATRTRFIFLIDPSSRFAKALDIGKTNIAFNGSTMRRCSARIEGGGGRRVGWRYWMVMPVFVGGRRRERRGVGLWGLGMTGIGVCR